VALPVIGARILRIGFGRFSLPAVCLLQISRARGPSTEAFHEFADDNYGNGRELGIDQRRATCCPQVASPENTGCRASVDHDPTRWLQPRQIAVPPNPGLTERDPGEREAIALAEALRADALIIDEKGRREAERRKLRVIGTVRVLDDAAEAGLLDCRTHSRACRDSDSTSTTNSCNFCLIAIPCASDSRSRAEVSCSSSSQVLPSSDRLVRIPYCHGQFPALWNCGKLCKQTRLNSLTLGCPVDALCRSWK
jgi:hypothetical protein